MMLARFNFIKVAVYFCYIVLFSGQAFTNPVDLIHAIENLNIPRHSRRHEDTSVKSPFSAPHFPPPVPSTSGTFSKIPVSQFGGSGSTAGGGNRVMRMEERMEVSQEQSPTKKGEKMRG